MKEILKSRDMIPQGFANCHDGEGTLICKSLLDSLESEKFQLMHVDDIPEGVSIGVHEHTGNEEIYYLQSGKGILTYDGKEFEMKAGDVSLCKIGHSHGFLAVDSCVLIVVACC